MIIRTQDLTGSALDWAVAKAVCPESLKNSCNLNGFPYWSEGWLWNGSPSTDWNQCGQLIDRHKVDMHFAGYAWMAQAETLSKESHLACYGDTPLIAICRAIVACELGESVDIPDELCMK